MSRFKRFEQGGLPHLSAPRIGHSLEPKAVIGERWVFCPLGKSSEDDGSNAGHQGEEGWPLNRQQLGQGDSCTRMWSSMQHNTRTAVETSVRSSAGEGRRRSAASLNPSRDAHHPTVTVIPRQRGRHSSSVLLKLRTECVWYSRRVELSPGDMPRPSSVVAMPRRRAPHRAGPVIHVMTQPRALACYRLAGLYPLWPHAIRVVAGVWAFELHPKFRTLNDEMRRLHADRGA
jgi:hypothetical protein